MDVGEHVPLSSSLDSSLWTLGNVLCWHTSPVSFPEAVYVVTADCSNS